MGQEQNPEASANPEKSKQGRLAALRQFIPTAQDAEIVKGMIADGLSNDQIMHALGYNDQTMSGHVLPNGHEHSNVQTTEQQEREAMAAQSAQPGDVEGGSEDGGEDDGDDMLTHVAGLLNSVSKKKAASKKPKK